MLKLNIYINYNKMYSPKQKEKLKMQRDDITFNTFILLFIKRYKHENKSKVRNCMNIKKTYVTLIKLL